MHDKMYPLLKLTEIEVGGFLREHESEDPTTQSSFLGGGCGRAREKPIDCSVSQRNQSASFDKLSNIYRLKTRYQRHLTKNQKNYDSTYTHGIIVFICIVYHVHQ